MESPAKCAVLCPIAATLDPITEACLRKLVDLGYKVNLLFGSSDIVLARCGMATEALRAGFAETLWVDSDQTFTPEDVEKIRSWNKPFVAGLYPKKGPKEFAGKFHGNQKPVTFGTGGGLIPMTYVGMGFTHVRREVYDKMERELKLPVCGGGYDGKTIVPYFLPLLAPVPGANPDYLSEDGAFSFRARQVGFPPMADTRLKIGHRGMYTYTWDDVVPNQNYDSVELTIAPTRRDDA